MSTTNSMTAFARHGRDTPLGTLTWEIKSVNHRYLDLALRLPEELRATEAAVREGVAKRLARGRIEADLRFQPTSGASSVALDDLALAGVLHLAREAQSRADALRLTLAPLALADLLRWPGVVHTAVLDTGTLAQHALSALDDALTELLASRAREGARLRQLCEERLDAMAAIVTRCRPVVPEALAASRARLEARLAELSVQADPVRLEMEMALLAQKADVDEELDRLATHLAEARRVLAAGGQAGRRLDFLLQEFNREANTLGSKSVDMRLTNASVELKVLIEQVREQVQNIE